ncbi:type II toxin-antitoxin system RelE/ParE family toxin [Gracilimonas sediminicola]|uniref:Type II toxin-antitoxin system RelE/ParE family toxin n=1 Tax=Gracilimonas sediminicola TaxID=2952158 RepID=A0A9X2L0R5_9BACT|nr:type II toxin-antitoxin system RelE/ParE family toxin [Gracilimonas sediminicola]MCP9290221.1 type II toxin-antitoxin system RelE/ParE family toxin [Gracilimonas sediminicola]
MKIIWSPTARYKTKEILEYISEDNPDAALTLIDLIEEKVENLNQNPESGRVFPPTNNDKIQELIVHENYGVIYEINPDLIEVLTVRHFRQDFSNYKL